MSPMSADITLKSGDSTRDVLMNIQYQVSKKNTGNKPKISSSDLLWYVLTKSSGSVWSQPFISPGGVKEEMASGK